jgi:tRNA threonylcarbamoyladenosine biosynthesis protein TsaE
MVYKSASPSQTKRIGKGLAKKLLRSSRKKALTVTLEGDLGGGKTTFLQGFAKGLGVKKKILSPTFVIMKKFPIPKSRTFQYFYHIDCYRIKKTEEVLSLGFKEVISNPENIVAIEWAGRIKKILPKERVSLELQFVNKNTRKVIINFRDD